jgi:uncharacterized protein
MAESLRNHHRTRYPMPDEQSGLVAALRSPDAYPYAAAAVDLVETHVSWVFLTGRFAYKVKKAVHLPFVDFSTLRLREHFCREELELNRRLAPELYLDVVPIARVGDRWRVGAVPAAEFAVRMRQFEPQATADRLIARDDLEASELEGLARRIAAFHASLPPARAPLPGAAVLENLAELEAEIGPSDLGLGEIPERLRRIVARREPECRERLSRGFFRECHGDLHLGNIARIDGRLVPFDCLEFDQALRTIDVIDEIAFLFMDLAAHSHADLAYAFLNAGLEQTGDFAGLRLLRFYAAHRALVRAKVAAIGQASHAATAEAGRYLEAARDVLSPPSPLLVLTSGLAGSGKTTIARQLALRLGAVHVRSDVERKRLHGLDALAQTYSAIDAGLYGPEASAQTYARLAEAAEAALDGDIAIIVDATFIVRERRDAFRALARRLGAHFVILRCEASVATLRERVSARARHRGDASEADLAVLEHQIATQTPIGADEAPDTLRIDTQSEGDPARMAAEVRARAQSSVRSTSY